jgi:hypothetical protein
MRFSSSDFSEVDEDLRGKFFLTHGMPHAYTSTGSRQDLWAGYIFNSRQQDY